MRCVEPAGHASLVLGLWRAARARRLAHALLFTGPEGVGKHLAAEWLACGLLCERGPERPCGACGACRRARSGSHPDALVLDPEAEGEEEIKVGRIAPREGEGRTSVGEFLSLRAMEGGWRIVLVRDAHRMTEESQNALLKTLEEPGESVLLVLSTSRGDLLLETTRSRCVRAAFPRLPREEVERVLRESGLESAEAGPLARWSGGAPGRALALRARGAAAMRAVLVRVVSGEVDAASAAAAIEAVEGEFPGARATVRARARAHAFFDLNLGILADLRAAAAGADPEGLPHGDLASPRGEAAIASALDRALAARQDVEQNLAPDAAIERALLALEDLAPAGTPARGPEP